MLREKTAKQSFQVANEKGLSHRGTNSFHLHYMVMVFRIEIWFRPPRIL
jgi:hypothetical protein